MVYSVFSFGFGGTFLGRTFTVARSQQSSFADYGSSRASITSALYFLTSLVIATTSAECASGSFFTLFAQSLDYRGTVVGSFNLHFFVTSSEVGMFGPRSWRV